MLQKSTELLRVSTGRVQPVSRRNGAIETHRCTRQTALGGLNNVILVCFLGNWQELERQNHRKKEGSVVWERSFPHSGPLIGEGAAPVAVYRSFSLLSFPPFSVPVAPSLCLSSLFAPPPPSTSKVFAQPGLTLNLHADSRLRQPLLNFFLFTS